MRSCNQCARQAGERHKLQPPPSARALVGRNAGNMCPSPGGPDVERRDRRNLPEARSGGRTRFGRRRPRAQIWTNGNIFVKAQLNLEIRSRPVGLRTHASKPPDRLSRNCPRAGAPSVPQAQVLATHALRRGGEASAFSTARRSHTVVAVSGHPALQPLSPGRGVGR